MMIVACIKLFLCMCIATWMGFFSVFIFSTLIPLFFLSFFARGGLARKGACGIEQQYVVHK